MRSEEQTPANPALLGTAVSVAPAAVGFAVGLLVADKMRSSSRQAVATTLFTLGALATLPLAVDYVAKTINRPGHRRGNRRRLRGIRASGVNVDPDLIGGEDFYLEGQEYQP